MIVDQEMWLENIRKYSDNNEHLEMNYMNQISALNNPQ